jgi:valyl-tRNA synthetase
MADFLTADEGGLALQLAVTRISGSGAAAPAAEESASGGPPSSTGAEGGAKAPSKSALKKLAKSLGLQLAEVEAMDPAEVNRLLAAKTGGDGGKKKGAAKKDWSGNSEKQAQKEAEKKRKALEAEERNRMEAAKQPKTPKGEKKLMTPEMSSVYQPKLVEAAWQDWWEASQFYTADAAAAEAAGPAGRFVIVIPPPNVTGRLHLGHALTAAIEDTLTRWHRMKGNVTLYVPGTDHAGIATQSIVEKQLKKKEGLSRFDLGREDFLKRVWEWKHEYGGSICNQIRQLGSSVDWSREAFTMDEKCSKAVTEAFVRFHEAGIITRDKRLVNWSCALKSAISNIEVDKIDIEGGAMFAVPGHTKREKYQFGMFTEFAYKLKAGQEGVKEGEEIVVATTRLETMLGDTAVAVHPKDPRYAHLVGKLVEHPFHPDREIPVITDDILVDMNLGTGAVKITPAHDPNDYACGVRHNLNFITIFTESGAINAKGGPLFEGMMRYDGRIAVEEELTKLGLIRGKEKRPMALGFCQRSQDIIEEMIMPQWFVDVTDMARRSVEAVEKGELKILPEFHVKTWHQWLKNPVPWCVSRQLWWGHRIPAYFATLKSEPDSCREVKFKNDAANADRWVVARSSASALSAAVKVLGYKGSNAEADIILEQDEDVLDTWFSSGLFPFSVLGWPDDTPDLRGFFPGSLLETGLDILFFWVARMVMMSLQLTDQLPFKEVYLHAMVRDKDGVKMSKSKGNVIDPLEVIHGCDMQTLYDKLKSGNLPTKEVEKGCKNFDADFGETGGIPECGADALRIGLLAYTVQGRDINLDIKRVVGYRNFGNKLWQTVKFVQGCFGEYLPFSGMQKTLLDGAAVRDRFILSKLNGAVMDVTKCFEDYEFGKSVQVLEQFLKGQLCDVYLELTKPAVYTKSTDAASLAGRDKSRAVLWTCLDVFLRLLHPICPFITEELWQRLPGRGQGLIEDEQTSIMVSAWPKASAAWASPSAEKAMEAFVLAAVEGARSLRADFKLTKKPADFVVACSDPEATAAMTAQSDDFTTLAVAKSVTVSADEPKSEGGKKYAVKVVNDKVKVFVDLSSVEGAAGKGAGGVGGSDTKNKKQRAKLEVLVKGLEGKLSNPQYLSTVPEQVQAKDRAKLAEYTKQLKDIVSLLSA